MSPRILVLLTAGVVLCTCSGDDGNGVSSSDDAHDDIVGAWEWVDRSYGFVFNSDNTFHFVEFYNDEVNDLEGSGSWSADRGTLDLQLDSGELLWNSWHSAPFAITFAYSASGPTLTLTSEERTQLYNRRTCQAAQ